MKTTAATLLEFSADKKHLGGTPFLMTVLHTWTQTLNFHPHVHALISSGALQEDGTTWHEHKGKFIFPVHALKKVFKGKFVDGLKTLLDSGEISLPDGPQGDAAIADFIDNLPRNWNVYLKPPYKSTQVVIRYFARYTNRTALSDKRIVGFENDKVIISCRRDSAEPEVQSTEPNSRTIEMKTEDFLLRFEQHIVPKWFHRIRYYGLMSPRMSPTKQEHLAAIFANIPVKKEIAVKELPPFICPHCHSVNTSVHVIRRQHQASKMTSQKREDTS